MLECIQVPKGKYPLNKVKTLANQIRIRLLVVLVGLVGAMALVACQSSVPANVAPTAATSEALSSASPVDSPEFPEVVPLAEPLQAPDGVPEELATVWEVWKLLTTGVRCTSGPYGRMFRHHQGQRIVRRHNRGYRRFA